MKFPSREQIAALRRMYPAGTTVELISMEDAQAPPPGTLGKVQGIDDAGQILVHWQTGSSLNLLLGIDSFRIVREEAIHERCDFSPDYDHSRYREREYVRRSCRPAHGIRERLLRTGLLHRGASRSVRTLHSDGRGAALKIFHPVPDFHGNMTCYHPRFEAYIHMNEETNATKKAGKRK